MFVWRRSAQAPPVERAWANGASRRRVLAALAWRFGLRSYRPSQRAGQQAFLGLMAGTVFLDRPLRALSPRRTDLRQARCASYA
ncbi:MAG: hypothetical protein WA970_20790, partial [Gammaproteobacteria bacterium]